MATASSAANTPITLVLLLLNPADGADPTTAAFVPVTVRVALELDDRVEAGVKVDDVLVGNDDDPEEATAVPVAEAAVSAVGRKIR
ncbi:hypothetical protein HDU93_010052 [Gonapodya sp. JEL0774]|nr:hypothetical protein HDU93_010052 [Gonapodya sp. JEL0774]